jgi:hypothetical protein
MSYLYEQYCQRHVTGLAFVDENNLLTFLVLLHVTCTHLHVFLRDTIIVYFIVKLHHSVHDIS